MKFNLTHYDLDGVVSSILIEEIFMKNDLFQIIPVGYNYLESAIQKLLFKKSGDFYITDLRLTTQQLKMLRNFDHVYYFDHHVHEEDFECPVDYCLIDTKKCASKIIYDKYKNHCPEIKRFKQLVEYTNDYDLWLLHYQESRILNAYFWQVKFETFRQQIKQNPEQITPEMKEAFKQKEQKILDFIKAKRYEVIGKVCVVVDKDVDMELTLYLPYEHYFFVSSSQRIHIKSTKNLTPFFEQLTEDYIENKGGHENAGGVVVTQPNKIMNVLLKFIEFVEG